MGQLPSDFRDAFLDRIARRCKVLKVLTDAGLGVYMSADEQQRKRAIELVVRMTARQRELPHLTADTMARAYEIVHSHLEAMQKVLPHDVQYRSRIRKDW